MNKETIKEIIYILIAILLGVLSVKFVIWMLPIILIGIVSYLIYSSMKKNKNENVNTNTKTKNKGKNIKVIHDLDDEDK